MIETTKDMISVWMGTSFKTPDEFNEYTDGMEDSDSHCPAFADFGVSFIDSDYFVAFHYLSGMPQNNPIILWHSRQIMEKLCQLKC